MAVTTRAVRLTNPTPGNHTAFYTVPAGKVAILRNVVMSYDGGGTNVVMGLILNGAGFIWDTYVADALTPNYYATSTVLTAGETLSGNTNQATGYIMGTVMEMDVADAPTAFKLTFHNITTQQGWRCPAGKKFRLRELVIAPHATTADINCYVGGIGYIYRGRVNAYEPLVLSTDFVIHQNEDLGIHASGGTFHAFFSGTLEDA